MRMDPSFFPPLSRMDLGAALGLLSRLPVPGIIAPRGPIRSGAWAYPVVGLFLGLIVGVVLAGLISLGVMAEIAAALALAFSLLLTGALHEDGLADAADGLGGGRSRERALEIMKDSRIGPFGIAALTLSLVIRWAAFTTLATTNPILGIMAAFAVSRMPMVLVMSQMDPARSFGAAAAVGKPALGHALLSFGLALVIAIITIGFQGPFLVFGALVAAIPLIFWASRCLGGQTGDVLGGIQQCAEIAILTILTASLT